MRTKRSIVWILKAPLDRRTTRCSSHCDELPGARTGQACRQKERHLAKLRNALLAPSGKRVIDALQRFTPDLSSLQQPRATMCTTIRVVNSRSVATEIAMSVVKAEKDANSFHVMFRTRHPEGRQEKTEDLSRETRQSVFRMFSTPACGLALFLDVQYAWNQCQDQNCNWSNWWCIARHGRRTVPPCDIQTRRRELL